MDICYKQVSFKLTQALSEEGSFEAYVAVYNNVDFGDDIIDPQAFSEEPAGKTYPFLSDHETKTVIGNYKVLSDGYGLKMVDAKFNLMRDSQTGNFLVPKAAEKYANLKNGDISGFSVGYVPTEVDYKEKDGKRVRIIKKAKLMEGSVVTFPMNDKARLIDIKSEEADKEIKDNPIEQIQSLKEIEKALKEKGFSIKESKTLISKVKKFSDNHLSEEQLVLKTLRDATAQIELDIFTKSLNQTILKIK